MFKKCDFITLHVPLNDKTRNTVNADTIALMKEGAAILNFAR
ncbi:MAG: 3-phosphoglycerate dehydrogenase, partial [Lachnospiraceae bacterium]|nr:3-phosphoglycerate dehydrogenase [Lachnospiraceae bacterium]